MSRKLFAVGIVLTFVVVLYAQGNKSVTVNGYLIDNMCAAGMAKEKDFATRAKKHKSSCALMPNCAGSGFAVLSDTGKLYKFDEAGNKSAKELLEETQTTNGVTVTVEGTVDGDTLHVSKLAETKSGSQ